MRSPLLSVASILNAVALALWAFDGATMGHPFPVVLAVLLLLVLFACRRSALHPSHPNRDLLFVVLLSMTAGAVHHGPAAVMCWSMSWVWLTVGSEDEPTL